MVGISLNERAKKMTRRYAQIDLETKQMISAAQALPVRHVTSCGAVITDFGKLPDTVLFSLGWVPVVHETIEPGREETHMLSAVPVYDEENRRLVFPVIPCDLEGLKDESLAAIDEAASEASARYISEGTGQGMRYLLKQAEARAFLAAAAAGGETPPADYPVIAAEAEAVGESLEMRAGRIAALADAWTAAAAAIEALRVSGKEAVAAATTGTAVIEARDSAINALEDV